jgi:hypothetical protein
MLAITIDVWCIEYSDIGIIFAECSEVVVSHVDSTGFDTIGHFIRTTQLAVREYLDLDGTICPFLDQVCETLSVPGLDFSSDTDVGILQHDRLCGSGFCLSGSEEHH